MGLIRAGIGAMGGTLADQWKEYFYCESIPENVMAVKGQRRVSGRSSNTKRSEHPVVPLTQKVMTTSFPTAVELLLRMDSVC